MFAWLVSDIDRSTRDAAARSVEPRVRVDSLEHVPIRQNIQMRCQERIVRIHEYMPRMRGRYSGEEVVGVANHHARLVEG